MQLVVIATSEISVERYNQGEQLEMAQMEQMTFEFAQRKVINPRPKKVPIGMTLERRKCGERISRSL